MMSCSFFYQFCIRNRHVADDGYLSLVCSRSLAAQQRSRAKEALAQNKSMQTTMAVGRKAIQVSAANVV